jgi:hypothetical protein
MIKLTNVVKIVSMKRVSLSDTDGVDDDDVVPATEIVMMSGEAIDPTEILRLCHGG